jgi:hypothetical protein
VPRRWLAGAAAVLLLAGAAVWSTAGGGPAAGTTEGNVVGPDGKGFEKVLPGQRFRHDPARTDVKAIDGRMYGTVVGTEVTGYVRTHKLEFEEQVAGC